MDCGVFSEEKNLVLSCASRDTMISIPNVTETERSTLRQPKSC